MPDTLTPYASVKLGVPTESSKEKLSSTGLTDGSKIGIGAFNILLSRDDVKCAGATPSAPVEPMVHRSIASV